MSLEEEQVALQHLLDFFITAQRNAQSLTNDDFIYAIEMFDVIFESQFGNYTGLENPIVFLKGANHHIENLIGDFNRLIQEPPFNYFTWLG